MKLRNGLGIAVLDGGAEQDAGLRAVLGHSIAVKEEIGEQYFGFRISFLYRHPQPLGGFGAFPLARRCFQKLTPGFELEFAAVSSRPLARGEILKARCGCG